MGLLKMAKNALVKLAVNAPVVGKHLKLYRSYKSLGYPPGHYYSTIPDLDEVERNKERIFGNETIHAIDLRLKQQLDLLNGLKEYYKKLPYQFSNPSVSDKQDYRYKVKDAYYRNSDAILLFCMVNYYKPGKIVEIGSGHSSALLLDTNEHFLNNSIELTFVEPYPEERFLKILRSGDERKSKLVKSFIQDVNEEVYTSLNDGDILFIDSSHVAKIGSDINFIFFEIFPKLKPGVLIHVHDIFFPFELPEPWISGRKWFWNENYILRAFLMNNPDYEILLFNDLLHKKHRRWFEEEMPDCLIDAENTGSIWIRKIR
jgi:hypothetical protein